MEIQRIMIFLVEIIFKILNRIHEYLKKNVTFHSLINFNQHFKVFERKKTPFLIIEEYI